MEPLTQIYVLVLRFVHIFGGVFWAGSGLFFTLFLGRAVKSAGPDGGKVMGKLITDTPWTMVISIASGLTALSGILLFAFNIARFGGAWGGTAQGIGFSIGGLAGISAVIIGGGVVGRTSRQMVELGAELAKSAGGPPPAGKLAQMGVLQARMDRFGNINAILLTIAVIMMAISRYLG